MHETPCAPPAIEVQKRIIQEDEFATVLIVVLLFIVRVWSVAALDRAIQRCYDVGGQPEVLSFVRYGGYGRRRSRLKWLISFLTGSLCAAAIAMGLVLISPGDTDVFEPYRIGSGAFTVYERTVEKEPGPDGTEHTVATTSMRSGILVWSLTGGLGFIALKAMSKKGNRDNGQD